MEQFSQKGILNQECVLLIYIFIILSIKNWLEFLVFWKEESKFSGITEAVLLETVSARDNFTKLCWAFTPSCNCVNNKSTPEIKQCSYP